MQRALFLAQVGLRDVRVNVADRGNPPKFLSCDRWEVKEVCQFLLGQLPNVPNATNLRNDLTNCPGARSAGRALCFLWDTKKQVLDDRVRLPLLEPSLEEAGRILGHDRGATLDLCLVATDQDPDQGDPRHWRNDTVELARFCLRYLQDRYSTLVATVLPVYPLREAPHQHDQAYRQVRGLPVQQCKGLVFLEASGGIPAVNGALRELCLTWFDDRLVLLQPVEVGETELREGKGSSVQRIPLRPFRADRLLRRLEDLVEAGHYDGAADLLEKENQVRQDDRFYDPRASALLRYAAARFNLDHASALEALQGFTGDPQLERWQQQVRTPSVLTALWDAILGAEACLRQGRLGDFVVRVAMALESFWRAWAEALEPRLVDAYAQSNGAPLPPAPVRQPFLIDPNKLRNIPSFANFSPDNYRPLQQGGPGTGFQPRTRSPKDPRWMPHALLFDVLVQHLATGNQALQGTVLSVARTLRPLQPLVELRNGFVHNLQAITPEVILHHLGMAGENIKAVEDKVLSQFQSAVNTALGQTPPTFTRAAREALNILRSRLP